MLILLLIQLLEQLRVHKSKIMFFVFFFFNINRVTYHTRISLFSVCDKRLIIELIIILNQSSRSGE